MAEKPSDPTGSPESTDDRPGEVVHDSRGKAVWKWSTDSDSTSKLLKRLEVPGLSIEEEETPVEKTAAQQAVKAAEGGGFNPYGDVAAPGKAPPPPVRRPAPPAAATVPKPAQAPFQKPPVAAKPPPPRGVSPARPATPPEPPARGGWLRRLFGKD